MESELKVIPRPEFGEGYYSIGKVLYYHGNDFAPEDHRVRDKEQCKGLGWEWSEQQSKAYDLYVEEVVRRYREAQNNRTPEEIAEQQAEARAAFGSGVKLVNVITGETSIT